MNKARWGIVVLIGLAASCLHAQGLDPVQELSKAAEQFPDVAVLKKYVAQLKTLPQFLEASQIPVLVKSSKDDWQALLEKQIRTPLKQMLKKVVDGGDEVTKIALAARIGEMKVATAKGGSFEGLEKHSAFLVYLSQDMEQLILSPQSTPRVREAAARALGNLLVDPAKAVSALRTLFAPGRSDAEKQAAATALATLAKHYDDLFRPVPSLVSKADCLAICKEVPLGVKDGLRQNDPVVRQACLQALLNIGDMLDTDNMFRVPPKDETKVEVLKVEAQTRPVLDRLNDAIQDAAFTKTLAGPPAFRLLSLQVLERLAGVRQRLNQRREEVALPPLGQGGDVLRPGLENAVKDFASNLTNPDPAVRLMATEFLERLGDVSAVVVPELTARLKDNSPFVRWAAVRTLGHIAYLGLQPLTRGMALGISETAFRGIVTGLAAALCEKDLDVRIAVADAFSGLAYTAHEAKEPLDREEILGILHLAVPQLAKAAQLGDRESRVAVLKALSLTGATPQQLSEITSGLIGQLTHAEPKVRQAAATTLGSLHATGASAALQKLLTDEDEGVRRAASEALLKIKQ